MSGPASIPVTLEPRADTARAWGNSLPILHEIRHALERLAETGEGTKIDLNAIPFGPGDEERLLGMLGTGEVEASVDALGPTRVWETSVHCVWLVDYRNLEEQRLTLHVEVTSIPDILCSQPQDIPDAINRLEALIDAAPGDSDPRSRQSKPDNPSPAIQA